jgi:tripartite-type tricarboxylate transporter receptor subunit TctC
MSTRREFIAQSAAFAALGGAAASARAQAAPQLPDVVKILCGFPPGGTSDAMSRRVADKITGKYAQTVVVENKPGAGGQIAVTLLKDSPADGSVMLLTPSSMLSLYPYVYKSLPYKPEADVQPVSLACWFDHALGVGPGVPESVKTVKDFIAWAKANPAHANYGSPGAGSMPHLIGAMLSRETGVELKHVPYRGSAPGIQDLIGGQIAAMSSPVGDYLPHLKGGKLRVLAISGPQRNPFIPDAPTYREQGYNIAVREWYGVFLPGKANAEVVRRASAALVPALAQPDLVSTMAGLGMDVQSSTPQKLAELLHNDVSDWARYTKQIGFTPES